jgi:hypothetical protein
MITRPKKPEILSKNTVANIEDGSLVWTDKSAVLTISPPIDDGRKTLKNCPPLKDIKTLLNGKSCFRVFKSTYHLIIHKKFTIKNNKTAQER